MKQMIVYLQVYLSKSSNERVSFNIYPLIQLDVIDYCLSWQPILEYIDAKYEEYLNAEGHVNRSTVVDNRVHCCLYFISPGHGLVAMTTG